MLYFGRFFDRIVLPALSVGKFLWAHSSVVERYPDKIEVEGPIPSAPILKTKHVKARCAKWFAFQLKI